VGIGKPKMGSKNRQILPPSHWSRGTAWQGTKITKTMAKMQ